MFSFAQIKWLSGLVTLVLLSTCFLTQLEGAAGASTFLKNRALTEATSVEALPDLYEASVLELQNGLDTGLLTSVDLIKVCFAVIYRFNLLLKCDFFRRILLVLMKSTSRVLLCGLYWKLIPPHWLKQLHLMQNARSRGNEVCCMEFQCCSR